MDKKSLVLHYLKPHEVEYLSTRSQGAGGQHVNKTNSCIQLRFSVSASDFPIDLKEKILKRLQHRLIQNDIIQIRVESQRDQKSNKDTAYKKLIELLAQSLVEPKKRTKTKPTKSSIKKRLDSKKKHSAIKKIRSAKWDK